METTQKLFSEFAPVTREQWKVKAIADLKGADFDKKLVWKTDDDFLVQPFYTEEDLNGNVQNVQNLFAADSNRDWTNYTYIEVTNAAEANATALDAVAFSATGILFGIKNAQNVDFKALLNKLNPETLSISFTTAQPDAAFIGAYFQYLQQSGVKLENVKGFYECDTLEAWITEGTEPDFAALAEVVKATQSVKGFKALVIKSHAFVNAGSNTTQEVAFTLNKLADYMDKLSEKGLTVNAIAEKIMLHMAIGGDYFFEMAKLRALKLLLNDILRLYGADTKVEVLSSNSVWSKSFYDPNVNMLRNTTEAMAALLGGCDALLVYPYDSSFETNTWFSQRVALNVSNLLKEESYFDKVVDPAAGSYYVESLTANLAEHALSLFKETEAGGGFIESFKKGIIQEKIGAVKLKKEKEIASRRRVYVGINKYPNLLEKTMLKDNGNIKTAQGNMPLLVPQHAANSFQQLKDRTLKHFEKTGFIPKVYPACFGNLAMRKARASFAAEFFGTAGFEIMGEHFFNDALEAAAESAKSDANIVVICSSDLEYEEHAVAFAEKFKSVAKNKILVLAGYPEKIVEDLKKAGVDTFIHVKSDAIAINADFQNKLF